MNLLLNICINDEAPEKTQLEKLSTTAVGNCEKAGPVEVKPKCEAIEKCSFGEKCCRLLQIRTDSRLELKTLEYDGEFSAKPNPFGPFANFYTPNPSRDGSVDVISYNMNPNVEYLLVGVETKFPNLKVYDAANCSIREIFWENFELLARLEFIHLANNKISAVENFAKTFGRLKRMPLKFLDLGMYFFGFLLKILAMLFHLQQTTASSLWQPVC